MGSAELVEVCVPLTCRREGSGESSLPVPEGCLRARGSDFFARSGSGGTRETVFKLKEGRLRLDMREKFFT